MGDDAARGYEVERVDMAGRWWNEHMQGRKEEWMHYVS